MIYRVAYYDDGYQSHGFEYFSNHTKAVKAIKESRFSGEISSFKTPKTKRLIIRIFNLYGGHPDNG